MKYIDWKKDLIYREQKLNENKMHQFGINKVLSNDILSKSLLEYNVYGINNITTLKDSYINNTPLNIIVGFGNKGNLHLGHLTVINQLLFYLNNFNNIKIYFVNLDIDYSDIFVKNMIEILEKNYPNKISYEIINFRNKEILKLKKVIAQNINLKTINRVLGWNNNDFYNYDKVINMLATFCINDILNEKNSIILSDINQVTFYALVKNIKKKLKLSLPCFTYHMLMTSLKSPQERMSINNPKSVLYLSDNENEIREKLKGSYTGNQNTCSYLKILDLFYESDYIEEKLTNCSKSMCSECKKCTIEGVTEKVKSKILRRNNEHIFRF